MCVHSLSASVSTVPATLQPLFVAVVRHKATAKPVRDRGASDGRQHVPDRIFRLGRALEVRRPFLELLEHDAQLLHLLRGGYTMARQRQLNNRGGEHDLTIAAMADVDDTGADTQEEHPVLLVLRAELGHRDIHPGLGDGVQRRRVKVELSHGLHVGVATREVDDLLGFAL